MNDHFPIATVELVARDGRGRAVALFTAADGCQYVATLTLWSHRSRCRAARDAAQAIGGSADVIL